MIISDIITEATSNYGLEGKPDWYDRAVKLKTDNPNITATEIGRQVGASQPNIAYWLTGVDRGSEPRLKRSNFPFKPDVFTLGYRQGGKPDWYDRAVKLKTDNPNITATEIGRQVGSNYQSVIYWLTGQHRPNTGYSKQMKYRSPKSFPFEPGDFPIGSPANYTDGEKPEWYAQALRMAKAGMSFVDISRKIGISTTNIGLWLIKGRKTGRGKIVNPDAELEPRRITGQKLDINLLNNLVADPDLNDRDILELIVGEYGKTAASTVKTMLPQLRQKQKAAMTTNQVIDKTRTGSMRDPNITGVFNR